MIDSQNEHFTAEITENSEVFIYLDEKNLDRLINGLQRLKKPGDHVHYMSENWGKGDLTKKPFDEAHKLSDHLQFILL